MPPATIAGSTVLIDGKLRDQAAAFDRKVNDREPVKLLVELDDGAQIDLPPELSRVLARILRGMTAGALTIRSLPDEVTTTVAAEMLGVSRPKLMRLVASGEIPARKVGTHTRLRSIDVLDFAKRRLSGQRAAFDRLRAFEDDLEQSEGMG